MARRGGGNGMAYNYALDAAKFNAQQKAEGFKETRATENDRLKEMHENLRDTLANQTERLKTATTMFSFNKEMTKMQKEEQALSDAAHFSRFYGMIKENDPNRKAQINELLNMFPNAIKVPEIHQTIAEDNKRIDAASKSELSPQDAKFLKENGPTSKGYQALQTAAGNPSAANHVESAITYGHVWDLMKRQQGIPTGTPEGIDVPGYVKGIESTFQKLPNGQPNPAYQPPEGTPPPSTPAPQNAAAWSNTQIPDIAQPNVPGANTVGPATGAPTAAPSSQNAREFLQNMGFKKTSDAGAAAAATTNRNELNDMLNQTPETQFAAPQPQPTATPTPPEKKDQFYTA